MVLSQEGGDILLQERGVSELNSEAKLFCGVVQKAKEASECTEVVIAEGGGN